jgi:hypothetical protein
MINLFLGLGALAFVVIVTLILHIAINRKEK